MDRAAVLAAEHVHAAIAGGPLVVRDARTEEIGVVTLGICRPDGAVPGSGDHEGPITGRASKRSGGIASGPPAPRDDSWPARRRPPRWAAPGACRSEPPTGSRAPSPGSRP